MAQVRDFNEMREYLKARAYFEDKIMWATLHSDKKQVEYYQKVIKGLEQAHKDYVTGELELDGFEPGQSNLVYVDEISMVKSDILLILSILAGVQQLPTFDSSDHYSI